MYKKLNIRFTYRGKHVFLFFLLLSIPIFAQAQSNPNIGGGTGIDADLYSNGQTYGDTTRSGFDDWFYGGSDTGQGIIDTTNAWQIKALLQGNNNISFQLQSAYKLWAVVNGRVNIIAGYGRDNLGGNSTTDSTTFANGAKNGDNFGNYTTGKGTSMGNVGSKSDIMDVWTAFKRDGTRIDDTLWLLGAVTTLGTNGNKNFDFEYNQTTMTYDYATGSFKDVGPDSGHTSWIFDTSGVPVQVGDVILACDWGNSGLTSASLKLWVHDTSFVANTAQGAFTWGTTFYGPIGGFGYADVQVPNGVIIENNNDTTTPIAAPPWGAKDGSGNYDSTYSQYQLLDFGINLTKIGVDPSILLVIDTVTGLPDPCTPLYYSFMAKSRTSSSFTSALTDFTNPITFDVPSLNDLTTIGDTTLNCLTGDTMEITAHSVAADLYSAPAFRWTTSGGSFVGTTQDTVYSKNTLIDQPGTYYMELSPYLGCGGAGWDTIEILIDTASPVATVTPVLDSLHSGNGYQVILVGGDTAASRLATNGTAGYTFSWTGPQSYTASTKDALAVDSGWFNFTITENRNGCFATAAAQILILPVTWLDIDALINGNHVLVKWNTTSEYNNDFFAVERYNNVLNIWEYIGEVKSQGNFAGISNYTFVDESPKNGRNLYRVKQVDFDGKSSYSPMSYVVFEQSGNSDVVIWPNPGKGVINIHVNESYPTEIRVLDKLGKEVGVGVFNALDQQGTFDLSSLPAGSYFIKIGTSSQEQIVKLFIKE